MINYKFHYKAGDREAEKITDDLIGGQDTAALDEAMAKCRAIQELCELFKIVVSKEIRTTVSTDSSIDVGQMKHFDYAALGIDEDMELIAVVTTLSRNGSYEDLTLHSYRDMP